MSAWSGVHGNSAFKQWGLDTDLKRLRSRQSSLCRNGIVALDFCIAITIRWWSDGLCGFLLRCGCTIRYWGAVTWRGALSRLFILVLIIVVVIVDSAYGVFGELFFNFFVCGVVEMRRLLVVWWWRWRGLNQWWSRWQWSRIVLNDRRKVNISWSVVVTIHWWWRWW